MFTYFGKQCIKYKLKIRKIHRIFVRTKCCITCGKMREKITCCEEKSQPPPPPDIKWSVHNVSLRQNNEIAC